MGQVNIQVSTALLREVLHLDTSTFGPVDIVCATMSGFNVITFTLSNKNFPEVPEAGRPKLVTPLIKRESFIIKEWEGLENNE